MLHSAWQCLTLLLLSDLIHRFIVLDSTGPDKMEQEKKQSLLHYFFPFCIDRENIPQQEVRRPEF